MTTQGHVTGADLSATADDEVLEPALGRRVLAIAFLFFGLSAANAYGGALQLVFFALCLAIALRTSHEIPRHTIALALACGVIAVVATLRYEPSLAPGLAVVRPAIEGYLVAVVLYACGIRTASSLMFVLGGYVLLQFGAVGLMLVSPGLRMGLLEQWYSAEGYQNQAFLGALAFRGFGVSKHHLYGLPLAAGTIAAMLVVTSRLRASHGGATTSMLAGLAAMVIVLPNARIGAVPVLVCYVLGAFLFRSFYLKQLLIVVPLAGAAVVVLAQAYLGDSLEFVSGWLLAGVQQFSEPDAAAQSTTVTDLGEMVVLPTSWSAWLIGEGRLCEPGDICYSDIGLIRLLQVGGLMLTAGVLALYAGVLRRTFTGRLWHQVAGSLNVDDRSRRQLAWVFFLTFVAATIKGESYGPNEYSRLLMMMSFLAQMVDAPPPGVEEAAALSDPTEAA